MLLRYHITVFGGRISGLYTHQYKISHIILYCFRHFRYSLKITPFRIRVTWHNNDCFILVAFRCFLQVGGSETDCGEGIPPARFGDDSHILTELVGDGILWDTLVAIVTGQESPDSLICRMTRCTIDSLPPSGEGSSLRNCLERDSFESGHSLLPEPPDKV